MNRRFWNAGQDGEIMSHVEEIEIKLLKLTDGQVHGHFKLCGCFGADLTASDEDEGFAPPVDAAETAQFVRKLMGLFDNGRPPGASC